MDSLTIPGPHGTIPIRVYRAAGADASPALVWAHGGGFAWGDLDMPEAQWVSLELAALGVTVVEPARDGVRFPVASEEVAECFRWTVAHAGEWGIDPGRVSLGGASAGGHLAAGAALRLRAGGGENPVSLMLAY